MACASLDVLGPVTLRLAAGAAPVALGRKAQLLLALLAVAGPAGRHRSELAALLWEESGEHDARNALRQCLHQLRKTFAGHEILTAAGERIAIDASRCDVDLWAFRSSAAESCFRLYAGPVAQGACAGESAQCILEAEREGVRAGLRSLVEESLAREVDAAIVPDAIVAVERLLVDDCLNEGCWRALMRLHAQAGAPAKVAQAWNRCREVLRNELGVEPSDATRATYENFAPEPACETPDRFVASAGSSSAMLTACRDGSVESATVDHMLRGWQLMNEGSAHTNLMARHAFEAAMKQSGDAAEPVAMVGWTHVLDFAYGWARDVDTSFDAAQECASRAMRIAPHGAVPHGLTGRVLLWQSHFEEARLHLERTLALAPGSAYAHSNLAEFHFHAGRADLALPLAERALQIEPHDNGVFLNVLGWALFFAGQAAKAKEAFERAATRNPRYCQVHAGLAAACARTGDVDQSVRAARRSRLNNRRLSLAFARDVLPFANPKDRQMLLDAWATAQMPECEAPFELLEVHAVPATLQLSA